MANDLKAQVRGVFKASPIGRLATAAEKIGTDVQQKVAIGKAYVRGYLKPKAKAK